MLHSGATNTEEHPTLADSVRKGYESKWYCSGGVTQSSSLHALSSAVFAATKQTAASVARQS